MAAPKIDPKAKQIVIVLFLLAAFAAFGGTLAAQPAQSAPELLRLEKSGDAMGATFSIILYGSDREKLESAADAAFEEVRRIDSVLSNYRPSSEWSELNRFAAERPVKVSDETFRLLSECLEYSRRSEGAFDITVGPLMKVWGFYKGTGRLPGQAEVAAALVKVGYRLVRLDAAERTVRFDKNGMEIDPGGIGKGYAVDRMVDVLKQNGLDTALVAASGSSIYGLGAPPNHPEGWRVTIRNPRSPSKSVDEVSLKNMSMSTSGSYEKFFQAGGRMYSHLMDPRTGYPAQGSASVSVVAPRTLDSEAWTKPYFVNGRQWAAGHKPKEFRVFFCEDRTEQACAWLQ